MVVKAASVMFTSQLATTLILFLRNILVARLISVEDFGIASTFSILFAIIETASNMSVKNLLVQHPDGDTPRFQNTLHSVQFLRGAIGAAAMIVLARPYAVFMNTPDIVWAYQALAIIPLSRGLMHMDVFRLQRHMRFMPFALTIVVSPVLGLAVVGVVYYLVAPDWQTMLWAIVAQQVGAVVLSHLVAERRYGLAWDMAAVRRSVSFGLPLLVNGIVLMLITNGERMIVGNQLGLEALAWFSAAFMLAMTPTRVITNTVSGLFLPRLSKLQDDAAAFRAMALTAMDVTLFVGLAAAVAIAVAGPAALLLLFGARYAPGIEILVILGLAQGLRIARTAPNTIAMAAGRTTALMWMGLLRATAVPAAFFALQAGYGLVAVAAIAVAGELAALALGIGLVMRMGRLPLRPCLIPIAIFAGTATLIVVDLMIWPPRATVLGSFHTAQLGLLAALGAGAVAMPRLRGLLRDLRRRRPSE